MQIYISAHLSLYSQGVPKYGLIPLTIVFPQPTPLTIVFLQPTPLTIVYSQPTPISKV